MPDPFITTTDLGDKIGRNVTADAGALMAVDAACDVCRIVAEQSFNRGTATLTMDGTGTDALLLPERPVSSVTGVSVAGGTITDYVLDVERGMLFRRMSTADLGTDPLPVLKWPAGRQNVTLTYVHGYENGEVPRDVRMVALSLAERLVIQGPLASETVGDVALRYSGPQMDLTSTEKFILDKYRSR